MDRVRAKQKMIAVLSTQHISAGVGVEEGEEKAQGGVIKTKCSTGCLVISH